MNQGSHVANIRNASVSHGIGEASARALAAKVIISDLAASAELAEELGGLVSAIRCVPRSRLPQSGYLE